MGARLGLGTAQFGLDYGIANAGGRLPGEDVRAILVTATELGVEVLDTAPAYGDAEAILGAFGVDAPMRVVTKTVVDVAGPDALRTGFLRSLAELQRPCVDGLLVHHGHELLRPGGHLLLDEMARLRAEGLVDRIGASVYHPEVADALLTRYPIEILQVPINVLDQRAIRSGALLRWVDAGVEVHARSVFLQGLLLSECDIDVAADCSPVRAFQDRANELGLSPLQAAVGFVASLPGVDTVICGVDRVAHLRAIHAALDVIVDAAQFTDLGVEDLQLLDPSRWQVAR